MPLYELTHESLRPVPRTTLHEQLFRERVDLQQHLKRNISILGEDLFILAEEFSEWQDSKRRVDLLAVDRGGSLVVIELKRTEDGGHMELQAIRYAAMVSALSFHQAVAAHAKFSKSDAAEAEAAILDFLGLSEPPDDFGQSVRIVLVSPDFSRELTTAVLWLNNNGLDIRCVRLRPYNLEQRTLLEIDQIIPLREAEEYTVRLKEKQEEARQAAESTHDFTRYDLTVGNQVFKNLSKRSLIWRAIASAVESGLPLETLTSIISSRKMVVVEGRLRGDEFLAAAQIAKAATGYVFRPKRLFLDDEYLLDIEGKTVAISNQWGLLSLPLIDEIVRAVPAAKISYKSSAELE